MINIFWYGRFKNRDEVVVSAEKYLNDSCPNIEHDVNILVDMHTELDDQLSGWCTGDNEDISIAIARRSQGEYFSYNELLTHLMHELIHAKQLILNQINLADHKKPYFEQPSEIEAYNNEQLLCEKYFKKILTKV